jgi:hypothetical protein
VLTYNDSLQPTIRNDNVNQLKVGLFHIKRRDNDVDVPLFLPAIVLLRAKKVGHQRHCLDF